VIRPSGYSYRSSEVMNPNSSDTDNCVNTLIESTRYQVCNGDARLVDRDFGPQSFNSNDMRPYYLWGRDGGRMLFVFPIPVTITSFKLHFYLDRMSDIARPKLKLVKVSDSYQVNDSLPPHDTPTTVERLDDASLGNALYNETVQVTDFGAPSNQVVLFVFSSKLYSLAITEMTFCTAGTVVL